MHPRRGEKIPKGGGGGEENSSSMQDISDVVFAHYCTLPSRALLALRTEEERFFSGFIELLNGLSDQPAIIARALGYEAGCLRSSYHTISLAFCPR